VAIKNQSIIVTYTAWDSAAQAPKAGDVANHTLRVITDGTSNVPSNVASEVDAVNAPGEYKITLTAGEMNGNFIVLAGVSATANVVILPVKIGTERGLVDQSLSTTESNIRGADSDDLKTISDEVATRAAPSDVTTAHATTDANVNAKHVTTDANVTAVHGTTDALIAALNDPTVAAIVNGVWDALLAAHTDVGSFGLNAANLDAAITTRATPADVTTAHATTDALIAALNDPTVAAIVNGVWDELVASHPGAGSFGLFMANLDAAITSRATASDVTTAHATTDALIAALNDPTVAAIVNGVWDALLAAHIDVGSFGLILANLDAAITTRATPANVTAAHSTTDSNVNAKHTTTDGNVNTKHTTTDALINALNDPTVAAIAVAVWDALLASHDNAGSFGEWVRDVRAYARGNVAVSGSTFAYKDTDDLTVRWTATVIAASRTNA